MNSVKLLQKGTKGSTAMVDEGRWITILSDSITATAALYHTRKILLFIKSCATLMRCFVQKTFANHAAHGKSMLIFLHMSVPIHRGTFGGINSKA
jgi:hypothetical protein